MVTATRSDGNNGICTFAFKGLQSDEKPTGSWEGTAIKNGSSFFEIDTQDVKFYDADTDSWV